MSVKLFILLFYPTIWMIFLFILKGWCNKKGMNMKSPFWVKFDEFNEPKWFWIIYQIAWLGIMYFIYYLFDKVVHTPF